MKKILFFLVLTACSFSVAAQQQYTINGKTLKLKTAVKGNLNLLWNSIDKQFRYFVKTSNGNIFELVNTKDSSNNYKEEYKTQLSEFSKKLNVSVNDLKFTLNDLTQFFKHYNTAIGDSAYLDEKPTLKTRLGFYGGLTNHPLVNNSNNTKVPFFGAELEAISSLEDSRHASFFSIEHALDNDDFKYSTTQLALGYRYRFIKKSSFNIYGNVLVATYNFSKSTIALTSTTNEVVKNSTFKIPFAFGLGADIKVSKRGFITLAYNELFAIFVEKSSNFPVNFAIGYKLNL
ncbi:hypothetical protein L3X37_08065 [Sabulilitoribacter arenilitoris]|uniref:Outer membrane protein beta-barrel domain-containing protein n=1 Tax=Wocania arenilitoris TaxID=2044858 RepID=A0AAE3ENY4_9FLAO|nr:hypothetical protein [Wocania arenilitoris]MCF7568317.1 hypothetical protein [Wocania arenilitoris]